MSRQWKIGSDCDGECSDPGSEFCRCYACGTLPTTRAPDATDLGSCKRCGWPLKTTIDEGCTADNCSCRCGEHPHCMCAYREDIEISRLIGWNAADILRTPRKTETPT